MEFVPFVSFHGAWNFSHLTLYSDSHLPTLRLEIDVIILILCKVQVGVINDSKTIQFLGGVVNTAGAKQVFV